MVNNNDKDIQCTTSMIQYNFQIIVGVPTVVWGDYSTENTTIAFLHPFLRRERNTFQYGTSISNQVCGKICEN